MANLAMFCVSGSNKQARDSMFGFLLVSLSFGFNISKTGSRYSMFSLIKCPQTSVDTSDVLFLAEWIRSPENDGQPRNVLRLCLK
jgi:hypothetical protein